MTESEIRRYCEQTGVPVKSGDVLRVMDPSQLPGGMREELDEQGFLKARPAEVSLKGKLPEDFPGHTALEAEGLTTYAKVRKRVDSLTEIPGIGEATAEKIREALETDGGE